MNRSILRAPVSRRSAVRSTPCRAGPGPATLLSPPVLRQDILADMMKMFAKAIGPTTSQLHLNSPLFLPGQELFARIATTSRWQHRSAGRLEAGACLSCSRRILFRTQPPNAFFPGCRRADEELGRTSQGKIRGPTFSAPPRRPEDEEEDHRSGRPRRHHLACARRYLEMRGRSIGRHPTRCLP